MREFTSNEWKSLMSISLSPSRFTGATQFLSASSDQTSFKNLTDTTLRLFGSRPKFERSERPIADHRGKLRCARIRNP